MKIETKFNIGDRVVAIVPMRPMKWTISRPAIQHVEEIRFITDDYKPCYYGDRSYGAASAFFIGVENDCFPTEAEAQAECDRRNAEIEKEENK